MSDSLAAFKERITAEQLNVLSVRVLQGGQIWGAWDRTQDERRLQHSISKSFTCMAVGLAVSEGKLDLNMKLGTFFRSSGAALAVTDPDLSPEGIRLYDLLRMSTGHDNPPLFPEERALLKEKDKDWAEHYMSLPLDRRPGERFTYSSGDTYMISALFQAVMGETVHDYLVPRLFQPLGMEEVAWESSPAGVTLGCAGLCISCEELSRFGQLLLQKGEWNGRQLVPESWISFVTAKQIDTVGTPDWNEGYGCHFWMSTHQAYRGDGAGGQLCIVLPERDAVIAINSKEGRFQDIMDGVWDTIYPAL